MIVHLPDNSFPSASARLSELSCTIEIAKEQIHGAFHNLIRLFGDCSQEFSS